MITSSLPWGVAPNRSCPFARVTLTDVFSEVAIDPAASVGRLEPCWLAYMADGAVTVHSVALPTSRTRTQKRASASIWGVVWTISRRLQPDISAARRSAPISAIPCLRVAYEAVGFTTLRGLRVGNGLWRDGEGIQCEEVGLIEAPK